MSTSLNSAEIMESTPHKASSPEIQKQLFIYYLNKIYDGKLYLEEHLPGVIKKTNLKVLQLALEELLADVKTQIARMEEIYKMLDISPTQITDAPIKTIINNACDLRNNPESVIVNDMDIMVHMQLVEHVNIISYRILRRLASLLNYKEIEQLMVECFDESRDDDKLFLMIADEYLGA
jgi:ferritin-like metal-binding protein YciE